MRLLEWALARMIDHIQTPDPVHVPAVPAPRPSPPPADIPERCDIWACWCRGVQSRGSGPYMRWAPGHPVARFLPDPALATTPARAA